MNVSTTGRRFKGAGASEPPVFLGNNLAFIPCPTCSESMRLVGIVNSAGFYYYHSCPSCGDALDARLLTTEAV